MDAFIYAASNAYFGWPGRIVALCAWVAYLAWAFGTHGGNGLARALVAVTLAGLSLPVVIVWIISSAGE